MFRRFAYTIALSLVVAGFSTGQTITGRITDGQTGEPLRDAIVVAVKSGRGAVSGDDGTFMIVTGPGRHTLEVRFLGYATLRREVTLKEGETQTIDFRLVQEIYRQEQIFVTANKVSMNRDNIPMHVTVVNQLEIEQSTESNILPVLSSLMPGLFVTERGVTGFGLAGGSAGKISIRGVGGSDASFPVLLLIDGQPQFMGMMGHPLPDSYVSSDIEKVEVVRGPASILYGTNAMGGAINLITRKQKEEGLSLRGRLMYGSFNTQKYAASAGYRVNRFSVLGSFNHDQTDGARAGSDFNINNGFLKVGYEINNHISLDANVSHSAFKAFDPGPVVAGSDPVDRPDQWVDIERTNSYFTLSNRYERTEGGIKGYYMSGDHDIYDGWKSNDENYGISLYQGFRIFPGNLVSAGLDLKKYGGRGTAGSLGAVSGKWIGVREAGAYLIVQQTIKDDLILSAGVRYDDHSLFSGQWIPQFGATWQMSPQTRFKASVSKGFRNPSIRDLYLFPPANSELLPENMWNYEITAGHDFFSGRGQAEVTLFKAGGDNLIIAVPHTPSPPPFKNQNSGKFSHYGLEAGVRFRIVQRLNLNASYSYLNMDAPKVASPEHQLYIGGHYHPGKFTVSAGMQRISNLYTRVTPASGMAVESYTLLSGRVNYQLFRQLTLFVSGENLLDQDYQMQYGYPMPGITLFTGMNITL